MTKDHRTFLLTWNPNDAEPEDLEVESHITRNQGLRVPSPWPTGINTDLPEGSRVFLLKRGSGRRGIIASGWCTAVSQVDSEAEFEFTMILDWENGQIVPEQILKEKIFGVDWHPEEGRIDPLWARKLEDLWVDELHRHGLREAGKDYMGWFRSKLYAWYRRS